MRGDGARALTRPVFLVGFMASGKSACGRALAERLGCGFVDTDARVVAEAGRSIDALFAAEGEGRFREREERALRALAAEPPAVVGTGGGLFLGYGQRRFMIETGLTVWLDVPLRVLEARMAAAEAAGEPRRPLWDRDDRVGRRALFEKRRVVYALARRRVSGWPGGPDEVAARVQAALPAVIFR